LGTQNTQAGPSGTRNPSQGTTCLDENDNGSEEGREQRVDPIDDPAVEEGDMRATMARNDEEDLEPTQEGPPRLTAAEELQLLRTWLKEAEEAEELRRLRDIRARYEAGDATALQKTPLVPPTPTTTATMPSASLPKPEPPTKFEKRDRAQYNRWVRDCEGYFERSHANFQFEKQKVDFGVMYVSNPLRTLWETNILVHTTATPGWVPTWMELKSVMLNSLGTPAERRKLAYDAIRKVRQDAGRSPTDLLDDMRPLWEELGPAVTPELQMLEYTSALRPDIQADLERLPLVMRSNLAMIEEQANIIYRRKNQNRESRDQPNKNKQQRPRAGSNGLGGDAKPPKKAKKHGMVKNGPKRGKTPHSDEPSEPIKCYNCGQPGHKRFECTNLEKPGSDPRKVKSGKEKGQKA
jgi:hypothetical protein